MADFEAPQSRNEALLQNMLGADNELEEPQSRIEALLLMLLEKLNDDEPSNGSLNTGDELDVEHNMG